LLEELKVLVQSSLLLQQQLLANQSAGVANASIEDNFAIPLTTLQQLEKLETDCQDKDMRGKLVCFIKFAILIDIELLRLLRSLCIYCEPVVEVRIELNLQFNSIPGAWLVINSDFIMKYKYYLFLEEWHAELA